jgi:SNF2 family DNA or RNA helicase
VPGLAWPMTWAGKNIANHLCFGLSIRIKIQEEKHLIVCPSSLLYNWEQELQKFAPGILYYCIMVSVGMFEQLARAINRW